MMQITEFIYFIKQIFIAKFQRLSYKCIYLLKMY